MGTATAMGTATLDMVEREEPRFVQFATGDVVEGTLITVERITVKEKAAIRYTVQEDGGACVSFLGTWQINTKLRPNDRGHRVSIRCVGEDTMVHKGENNMKVFKVLVSKNKVDSLLSSTEITDDDIPF